MNEKELVVKWKRDERAKFTGWDFSYLKGRWIEESPSWDYMKLAKYLVKNSSSVIDIETGGGERFCEIISRYKKKAVALEGYNPNVEVARKNLSRFSVKVVETQKMNNLPFRNGEFDLILNRHGAINEKEFYRILNNDGIFLTQQVDGSNFSDLKKFFGVKSKFADITLMNVKKKLKKEGFTIMKTKQWTGKYIFYDVGALVYYLKAIPFLVDGFSIETHIEYLKILQKKIEKKGKLEFIRKLFLIEARKLK